MHLLQGLFGWTPGGSAKDRWVLGAGLKAEDATHKKNGGVRSTPPFLLVISQPDQVQTIAPLELSQVFADCEWVAVALHVWGGPATIVAVMVTFCEGVKPCSGEAIVAEPAKDAPLLSAADCYS